MSDKKPITKEGYDKVQLELDQLIKVEREEIKQAIAEARELGDLKENAEYHAAKEKQSSIEGRILELQGVIAQAQVIKVEEVNSESIVFGATVSLIDVESEKEVTYQLVGDIESDTSQGKVSISSPIGRALLGKEEGDTVIVKAPKGDIEYEIQSIEYK